jgi:CheY-like chemotaxis protein
MNSNNLVLVVDDHGDSREVLATTLQLYGVRVISASDGFQAVEIAIEHQPRLVLMDLRMPGMDGYEATRAILAHPDVRETVVVAISAYGDDPSCRVKACQAGCIECLTKPYDEQELLRVLRSIWPHKLRASAH